MTKLEKSKARVIMIGIDRLLTRCMQSIETTAFEYLAREGSWTLNATTAISSIFYPGSSNILCGVEREDKEILENKWKLPSMFLKKAEIHSITRDKLFPCIFSKLKYYNKKFIKKVTLTGDFLFNINSFAIPSSIGKEDFCYFYNNIDLSIFCDEEIVKSALISMSEGFDFLFIYFGSLDKTGDNNLLCSDQYIKRMNNINKNIEMIINGIKNLDMFENTFILLTSENITSYLKNSHGLKDDNNNLQVPFYIMGPGIKKNYKLKVAVKNEDVASAIANLFGYSSNKFDMSKVTSEAFESIPPCVEPTFVNLRQ